MNQESTYDFVIKSYESDFKGNISLPAFFLLLQECAWENAKKNGFGYEFVEEESALWVLSKVKLKIISLPKWKDKIEIRTWPRPPDGIYAIRDYQLLKNGKAIAMVSSYWLILDKLSKRPRRVTDFDFAHYSFINESALGEKLGKLKLDQDPTELDQRKVYHSDLDINGHVNNASYVKWVIDAHYALHKGNISSFEINFMSELHLNDQYTVAYVDQGDKCQYVLMNSINNKPICYAELRIE